MALQSSGSISWTQISQEFGAPIGNATNRYYVVPWVKWNPQTPWVKSSDGEAGWYNSGAIGAWSQFMIDHAFYPSNTNPLVGTHSATWRIGGGDMNWMSSGLPLENAPYTLECQADNSASFTWNETVLGETNHGLNNVNTSTTFTIDNNLLNNQTTEHYLTTNVTNGVWIPPDGYVGVRFLDNGDIACTGYGTKTIKLRFGWDDGGAGGDGSFALGTVAYPDLGLSFTQDSSVVRKDLDAVLVTVQGGVTYSCTITDLATPAGGLNPFRANERQRLCFKDATGGDSNAALWLMEDSEDIGWYKVNDNWLGDGTSGDAAYNTTLPSFVDIDGGDWKVNPGGVAWQLKNSSGAIVRSSSDSFNYDHASTMWGSMLQNYAVYPSNSNPLTDQWQEANYVFEVKNAGTYTLEGVADSKSEFYLFDGINPETFLFGTLSGSESCNTGLCNSVNLGELSLGRYRIRVLTYNTSTSTLPTNSWFHNPGGVAFIVRDINNNIIKTSLNVGIQDTLTTRDNTIGFGNYRVSEYYGSLTEIPLDTDAGPDLNVDIPQTGEISFSNFYNSRLNMVLDYYRGDTETRPEPARNRYNLVDKVAVVGGFRGRPTSPTGKKVIIHINKSIGLDGGSGNYSGESSKCAFRTGTTSNWGGSSTKLILDIGSSGKVIGAGGNGGAGADGSKDEAKTGGTGGSGTGAIGIQHEGTVVNVRANGMVVAGGGGGGGGGNASSDGGTFTNGEASGGGGGGGGAGFPSGAGGEGGDGSEGSGKDGTAGTLDVGGSGGSGKHSGADSGAGRSGDGGDGGDKTKPNVDGETGDAGDGDGGAAGENGGAIRKTTGTTWTFGDEHVTNNVYGDGKGGVSESPTGVE